MFVFGPFYLQAKKENSAEKSTMTVSLNGVIALIGTPTDGGSALYQPVSKIIGACSHKEGGFGAKWYFTYIAVDNDMLEGSPDCKYTW